MEKYGFVYIWRDRKHKRFYIGCHWGNKDDGYICSSNWMRRSYKRRPQDFRRKIIQTVSCRNELLEAEGKWLNLIPIDQLGKTYYNLTNHVNGHWTLDNQKNKSIKEKISNTKKKFWSSDKSNILRERVSFFHKNRGTKPPSQKGRIPWNKGLTKKTDSRVLANAIACSKPKSKTENMGRYKKNKLTLVST
jgi:hypothetical protein